MNFEEVMQITRGVSSATCLEDAECEALYHALLRVRPGGIVVEVGCQLGRSSSIIAQLQNVLGYHAIYIDPYTEQPDYLQGWAQTMHKIGSTFTLMHMRTEQAEWLLGSLGQIDLAFIDGDHEYPSVMTDLELVAERVRRGGSLLMHDYERESLPRVKEAAIDYFSKSPNWQHVGCFGSLGFWFRH